MAQKRTPAASLLLYFFHWHTLSIIKWIKEGNISAVALRYFDKQYQKRLKGNRDPCAPRKSIESDYLEREQVESQGGPCHVHNLSLLLSGHSCQPCKCSVRVIREQRGPRQSTANLQTSQPSGDTAQQQASAQGQVYFVSLPALKMDPFSAQSGTILCKQLRGQ